MANYKYIVLAAFFILKCLTTQAQEVFYSEEQKFNFKKSEFVLLGKVQNLLYTFRTDDNRFFLDAYTDSMKQTAVIELDFIPQNAVKPQFVISQDQIVVSYQYFQNNMLYLCAVVLDQYGKMKMPVQLLDSVKATAAAARKKYGFYDQVVSHDKSKIAFYIIKDVEQQSVLETLLFDSNLSFIAQHRLVLSRQAPILPQQIVLGNDGQLYVSSYYYHQQENQLNDNAQIFKLNIKEQAVTQYYIPLDGIFIDGLLMKLDQVTDELQYSGFYATTNKAAFEGFIYGKLAMDANDAPAFKLNKISEEMRATLGGRKQKKAINNYQIKDVIVKNDGGLILIAEDSYITTKSTAPAMGFYSSYYGSPASRVIKEYNYGDLLMMSFDSTGNVDWNTIIRKHQYSQEDQGLFSSYAFANTGAFLVFVYNDFSLSKNKLTVAAVNAKGKIAFSKINVGEKKLDWVPRYAQQVGPLAILFPCFKGSTLSFSLVKF